MTNYYPKRWLLFFGFGAVGIMVSVGTAYWVFFYNPEIARAREGSVQLLAEAQNVHAMEEAVGELGILFHFADGSWIAVRYVDHHHGDFWSSAVALDSTGRWYESEVHFCGQFRIYRGQWDRTLEILADPKVTLEEKKWWIEQTASTPSPLRDVEECADLETASANLLKLGFRSLANSRIAKISGPWPVAIETKKATIERLLKKP